MSETGLSLIYLGIMVLFALLMAACLVGVYYEDLDD